MSRLAGPRTGPPLNIYHIARATLMQGSGGIRWTSYYCIAVTLGEPFQRWFFEMAGLSLSVAAFGFLMGFLLRTLFGVDI